MKKWLMTIGVWSLMAAVIYLSVRSRVVGTITGRLLDLMLIVFVVGGSIYKLTLWWRYRHDPAMREKVVFSTQLYPSRLRRFFYDEKEDKENHGYREHP